MVTNGPNSQPKLELFKCTLCRRAFFSHQRLEHHTISSHTVRRRRNNIPRRPIIDALHRRKKAACTRRGKKFQRSLNYRESVLNTLISNWPPEKAYSKICKKHNLSRVKAQHIIKSMISSRFCPMLHSSLNVLNFLLEEYSKDSTTTWQRTDDICHATGLSTRFIELWFLWRRTKGHFSPGNELLNDAFFEAPYPSDDEFGNLMSATGLLVSQIQLRFRLMRAKFQVLEFKEAHEKVLWAFFMKNPGSIVSRKEASETAGLVGMKTEDVQVMFEYWRMHWLAADNDFRAKISAKCNESCSSVAETISDENVLNTLERVRQSQKMFGIPTRCQLMKNKRGSGVVTQSGYVKFGPYVPQRSKNNKKKANSELDAPRKLAKASVCHSDICENLILVSSEEMDCTTCGLKLQSDVFKGDKSLPLPKETDVEPNLRSLFSTIPSSQVCSPQQSYSSGSSRQDILSSSESDVIAVSSSEESDDGDEYAVHMLMPRPLNDVPEVIDLTLDSDSTISDGSEVIEKNEDIHAESESDGD